MIAAHQPTIFPENVRAGVSASSDGTMKFSGSDPAVVAHNITRFAGGVGIAAEAVNYLTVTYDRPDFTRYERVGIPPHAFAKTPADGLATDVSGAALFLPLADCTGAIFYDPTHHALMVSHLGRHSTEQYGARETVRYLGELFGTDPADLLVWLGPSPNGGVYPLWARDNMGLIEANRLDLFHASVAPGHIEASAVDPALDADYFSHSEFLKGHRDVDGRFAIIAMLA